jgi:hypothetical protein
VKKYDVVLGERTEQLKKDCYQERSHILDACGHEAKYFEEKPKAAGLDGFARMSAGPAKQAAIGPVKFQRVNADGTALEWVTVVSDNKPSSGQLERARIWAGVALVGLVAAVVWLVVVIRS